MHPPVEPLRTPGLARRSAAAIATLLVVAATAFAQDPAPSAPSPEEPAPPAAIPLTDVLKNAESTLSRLASMLPTAKAIEALDELEMKLRALRDEVETEVAHIQVILDGTHDVGRLQDLEQQLAGLSNRISAPDESLDAELRGVTESLDMLDVTGPVWDLTRDAARKAGASAPTLERIRNTQREIERTRKNLITYRNRILTLRDGLLDPKAAIDRLLADVRAGIANRLEGVFKADGSPLWSPLVWESLSAELAEGWTRPLERHAGRIGDFLVAQRLVIGLQLSIFIALAVGLRSVRRRAQARAEESYDLREAGQIFELPNSMALVIALSLTPQLHPGAPYRFDQLVLLVAVVPVTLIVRRLAPRPMAPLAIGVPIFFVIDRLRDSVDFLPTLERLILFSEHVGALAFIVWLLRPSRLVDLAELTRAGSAFRFIGYGMRTAAAIFALAIVANAVGLENLASLTGSGTLRAGYGALVIYAIKNAVQSLVVFSLVLWPINQLKFVNRRRSRVRRRLERVITFVAVLAWIGAMLRIYGLDAIMGAAIVGALQASLEVGALSISAGDVLVFGFTAWLTFAVARFIHTVLQDDVFPRVQLARGVPYAIQSLVRYTVIFFGFLVALAAAGIELSKLTVIAGGLGVGIGFGLQNVVNNFVSGLILLFERPVQTGDTVQLQGHDLWGEIKRIGIRASVVRTWDGAEVIVPNGQLISDALTNWTLSDRRRRIDLNIGVAYGTDAQRVIDLLLEVANTHEGVLQDPSPICFFVEFGDSSLDFLLRCWIADFDKGYSTRSELNVAIQRALADADISVPFPQRDLHVRSVSAEAGAGLGPSGSRAGRE